MRHPALPLFVLPALLACDSRSVATKDSVTAQSDETPVFDIDLWPGEGIPIVQAVRDSLPLRPMPNASSALLGAVRAGAGGQIAYDSTRFQTLVAATAIARVAMKLEGRDFGDKRYLSRDQYYAPGYPRRTIELTPGARVEYLQPRAEGTCFVRAEGHLIEADPCIVLDESKFTLHGEPVVQWWIHVPSAGAAGGWLIVSDSTARVVNRTF